MHVKQPQIAHSRILAETQLFCVEQQHIQFANGAERVYERLISRGLGAVLVVPLLNDDEFLLIKEWSAGTARYELAFPKGKIDAGETALQAANRECQEEVGYAAKQLHALHVPLTVAPGYMTHQIQVVIARDLYPQTAEGDEPEPLETLVWRWDNLDELLLREDFTEARSIAALWLVKRYLRAQHAQQ